MPVEWRPAASQLHLHNGRVSHVMRVLPSGSLAHLHFGAPLHVDRDYAHLERQAFVGRTNRDADDVLVRANAHVRGGDDLMRVGLLLDDYAWEAQARGDFQARLFVLEAATG